MQEPSKFCPRCNTQNYEGAMFCYSCSFQFPDVAPARRATKPLSTGAIIFLGIFGCLIFSWISNWIRGNKTTTTQTAETAPTPTAFASSAAPGGERMVMDNAQVTVYVECTNREYKQYKVRFIVKKPGSSLIAPIVRMAGISNPHSVVVNGVDTGDDFAFSPNMAVFDKNLELVQANYQSRPLNGNVALGYAYHDLVMKYEKGN